MLFRSSARGIDIANVEYVVNYDMPEKAENYVHRVGRTGRGTKRGIAISFCSTEEIPVLKEIEEFMDKDVAVLKINKQDYEAIVDTATGLTISIYQLRLISLLNYCYITEVIYFRVLSVLCAKLLLLI